MSSRLVFKPCMSPEARTLPSIPGQVGCWVLRARAAFPKQNLSAGSLLPCQACWWSAACPCVPFPLG